MDDIGLLAADNVEDPGHAAQDFDRSKAAPFDVEGDHATLLGGDALLVLVDARRDHDLEARPPAPPAPSAGNATRRTSLR